MNKKAFFLITTAIFISMATLVSCKKDKPTPVISITSQPQATITIPLGGTEHLSVVASVTEGAKLTYQWYFNTSASNTNGTKISGATTANYDIPTNLSVGTYYYFCEVGATGAESKRSNVATVVVEVPPPANQFEAGGFYFKAISEGSTDVKVTNKSYSDDFSTNPTSASNSYPGPAVTVPATVNYQGVTYTVKRIGAGAFHYCASLTSVTLPVGIEQIEWQAFYGCSSLETVVLPASGLTAIGSSAFSFCTVLPSLTLPEGLRTIGGAFQYCTTLASLHIPSTVISIDTYAFLNCSNLLLTAAADGAYSATGGALYRVNGNNPQHTLEWFPIKLTGEFTIPAEVVSIGTGAMQGSNLTKIIIPASVASIGDYSFAYCPSLTDITLPWADPAVCTIGDGCFYETPKVNITLHIPAGSIAAYTGHSLWGAANGWKAIIAPDVDAGVTINGVIWATRNVGEPGKFANKPEDAGMFYQWNRITGWSGTDPLTSSPAGFIWDPIPDLSAIWEATNDPCPAGWQVPTKAQSTALYAAPNVWDDAKKGQTYGTAPNTIFLPAVGNRNQDDGSLQEVGMFGTYLTSSQGSSSNSVYQFHFSVGGSDSEGVTTKSFALPIRCVKK